MRKKESDSDPEKHCLDLIHYNLLCTEMADSLGVPY